MIAIDFSKIDTPEKAYLLGFIIADGVISSKYKVSISSKDFEILQKCKVLFGCNNKISEINVFDKRTNKKYKTYILQIGSKQLVEDLGKLGVHPRKSWNSTYPDIDEKYSSHFLRGLFDGDGSISTLQDGQHRFSIIGSEYLIKKVQELICKFCLLSKNKLALCAEKNGEKIYKFGLGGKFQIMKVLDFLYNDSTELTRLNRKYERYLLIKESSNKKTSIDNKKYTSKYKGVHLRQYDKRWIASFFGKFLGAFNEETDAANCYNKACFDKFGEKNRLNKIENTKV